MATSSSSSSSSSATPTKLPDFGKSIATAMQVVPILRGSNFDSWKARYGDVANMLKWHDELLDLDPNAGPYDLAHETELQGINRSIAWQVIVKTLAEQSDIIEGQETEGSGTPAMHIGRWWRSTTVRRRQTRRTPFRG